MTAIVGYIDNGGDVHLAGDTRAMSTSDYSAHSLADGKVFRTGSYLMGYTTSFRMGQVLEHSFVPPNPMPGAPCDMRFMVNVFVTKLRAAFKANGFATKDKEVEEGGTFLVGYVGESYKARGILYRIQEDYAVLQNSYNFDACGCGSQIIMGSMFSSDKPYYSTVDRLLTALEAAAAFSGGVGGPFTYIKTGEFMPVRLER